MFNHPSSGARRAFVSLGSNLGDRNAYLKQAVQRLGQLPGTRVTRRSSLYRTDPVGYVEQPWFLNAVVELTTHLDPLPLLGALLAIEAELGRVRSVRWGPRTLDLDLLAMDDIQMDTEQLVLPHPRFSERRFVLVPWQELDPDYRIKGKTVAEHLRQCPDESGVYVVTEAEWHE